MNVTMAKPILSPGHAALLIRDGVTVAEELFAPALLAADCFPAFQ